MGRKNRPSKQAKEAVSASVVEDISALGWKVIAAGVVLILLGFFVLSRADPMGRNWAAHLSPFLLLGGYAVVALGIFLPETPPACESAGPPAAVSSESSDPPAPPSP